MRATGFVLAAAVAVAFAAAALDEEAGLARWLHLRSELADAQGRIESFRSEISLLEREAELLKGDAFAVERAIREELELVRPGQQLIRLTGGTPSSWNP